jgi:hypothetical protein
LPANSLAVQTTPVQDAKSAFADWILTRAGGLRAFPLQRFESPGVFPNRLFTD